jgi:hypothetical protein
MWWMCAIAVLVLMALQAFFDWAGADEIAGFLNLAIAAGILVTWALLPR